MADTILTGDVTIAYLDESRQKRISWSGSPGETYTMNALYSALMDHFDEPLRMDNPSPMSAQTPVEYTTGIIDSGDTEPWYTTYELMEHMTGGALRTSGWTRDLPGDGTGAIGIVVVPVTAAGSTIVAADAGNTISHADGDSGTLLEVISNGGTNDYLVIRPDTNALADDWNSTSGTITEAGTSHTATQNAAAVTGEQIWANLYSIGTIEDDTHIYLYQGDIADNSRAHVYSVNDNTQDWWVDGHIDICIPIRDWKTASAPIVDGGYITAYARKGTTEYAYFEAANSTTSGGRNPVPLGTKSDLNNTTGNRSITTSSITSDTYAVGDTIVGGTSGARAIITGISGTNPNYTFEYYLIDDPQTDFQTATETVNAESPGTGTGSKNGSAAINAGPAEATWFTSNTAPTIAFAAATFDTDDNGTDEYYAITIDCNANPLTEVYEWLKYITGRGYTTLLDVGGNSTGIEGEQYIGGEVYLSYTGAIGGTTTLAEGDDVSQATSLATGVIVSLDTTNKKVLLRNVRGTFDTTNLITGEDGGTFTADDAAVTFAPNAVSPFGTFAGGTFFGARGVLLSDWLGADENSFQLTPLEGGTKQRPQAITLTVSNLIGTNEATLTDDRVTIFRLTGAGGSIDKTEYSATGGEAIGGTTIALDTPITQDTPGKTTGGTVRMRDASNDNKEYRMRFTSWNNTTNTPNGEVVLANVVPSNLTGSTDSTTIVSSTDELDGIKRGDLVLNATRSNAISYVTSVNAATNTVTIDPAIPSQISTDSIEFNAVPVAITAGDDIYIPLLDEYAIASTASASIVYSTTIDFRVVARNSTNNSPNSPITPFTTDDATSGTDRSNAVVRTFDTIRTF
jgi:hypothetical protein